MTYAVETSGHLVLPAELERQALTVLEVELVTRQGPLEDPEAVDACGPRFRRTSSPTSGRAEGPGDLATSAPSFLSTTGRSAVSTWVSNSGDFVAVPLRPSR